MRSQLTELSPASHSSTTGGSSSALAATMPLMSVVLPAPRAPEIMITSVIGPRSKYSLAVSSRRAAVPAGAELAPAGILPARESPPAGRYPGDASGTLLVIASPSSLSPANGRRPNELRRNCEGPAPMGEFLPEPRNCLSGARFSHLRRFGLSTVFQHHGTAFQQYLVLNVNFWHKKLCHTLRRP